MCQLFISADEDLWKPSTRSLRIDGVVTSIRLENFFWATLEEIGARDDMSYSQLITKLYLEAMDAEHDLGNFTSFLRVCCARYLSLIADGHLNRSDLTMLADVPASEILKAEQQNMATRRQATSLKVVPAQKLN